MLKSALSKEVMKNQTAAKLDALQAEVDALKRLQAETTAELDALLPAIAKRLKDKG